MSEVVRRTREAASRAARAVRAPRSLRWARARAELAAVRVELAAARARRAQLEDVIGTREVAFGWAPGHFYSPIPDLAEVRRREGRIFDAVRVPAGVDLRERAQLRLLEEMLPGYAGLPWSDIPVGGLRYGYENDYYAHCDGVLLGCLLQHLRPQRYLEIGSGWSTALALDARDHLLEGSLDITCVEPYPDRLERLTGPGGGGQLTLVREPFEDLDLSVVEHLEAGDVLFVDSSHVVKVGGDVNRIVLQAMPQLAPGVWVHVHDVFWPFEYPARWVYEGRAWTEAYLLHAFLAFNERFEIALFNDMIFQLHREWLAEHMPLCLRTGPSGIWLRRRA